MDDIGGKTNVNLTLNFQHPNWWCPYSSTFRIQPKLLKITASSSSSYSQENCESSTFFRSPTILGDLILKKMTQKMNRSSMKPWFLSVQLIEAKGLTSLMQVSAKDKECI
jgi:hypothetical protein